MRFNTILLALNFVVVAAHAQQLTPKAPLGTNSVAPAAPTAPANATAGASTPATAGPTASTAAVPGPGVVTLSDMAKQATAPAQSSIDVPRVGAIQPTPAEVQAITILDGNGRPVDVARAKLQSAEANSKPAFTIGLTRLSTQGMDSSAVLWVKGQNRRVVPGGRVLQYTVGEIREDGVCLYIAKGKVKNKCSKLVTFLQGV